MKKSYITITILILLLSICVGACKGNRKGYSHGPLEEETDIAYIERALSDSMKTMNMDYVRKAISRAKEIAKDSDDYYYFVMYESMVQFYLAQPDSLLFYLDQSMNYLAKHSSTLKRDSIRIKCMQLKAGYFVQYYANLDSSIYYSLKACELSEKDPVYLHCLLSYSNLAGAYKQKGELAQSAYYYRKAIFLADSMNTATDGYIQLYCGIASTYTALHDFEQSKIWWDKAEKLWSNMMTYEQFNYLNNRGNDYYYQKDYQNCLKTFIQLDTFLQARPIMDWERHYCHVNLTDVYLKLNQPNLADSLLSNNLEFFKQMNDENVLFYLNTQQMELAFQKGNYGEVERLSKESPFLNRIRPEIRLTRLEFLQKYHTAKMDWKNAYHYQHVFRNLDDSLRNERVKMKTADLQMQYERDATVLNQRIYIGQQKAKLMKIYTAMAIASLIVLLLLLVIYYRRKNSKMKEEQMLHRIVELRMENIRNRITPHFIYNALNHELLAQQQGKPTQLNILVNLLRQGQALANVFCTTLKEEMDFIQLYVQIEGESLGENFKYITDIEDGIEPENIKLPSMMVQIFVENAIKHGLKSIPEKEQRKEKNLIMVIFRKDDSIYIEVRNNGMPLNKQHKDNKTQTGLRVVSQTIQLLNERNKHAMSYSLKEYQDKDGEIGCCAQLIIPNHYNFNIN